MRARRFDKMPRGRARYSEGYVKPTKTRQWQANWFPYVRDPHTGIERRVHRTQIVGSKATMNKCDAVQKLRELSGAVQSSKDHSATVEWFMRIAGNPCTKGNGALGHARRTVNCSPSLTPSSAKPR